MVVYYALNMDKLDIFASIYSLIEYCRTLLNLLDKSPIKHVYGEANRVAYWMAKNANSFCNELNVYEQPPSGL